MKRTVATGRLGTLAADERGAILVFTALALPLLLFCLTGVDLLTIDVTRTRLSVAADAAALAAARQLPDRSAATTAANEMLVANHPALPSDFGGPGEEIVFGAWDETARSFAANAAPETAVLVRLSRTRAHGNAVALIVLTVGGLRQVDVSATSVATFDGEACGAVAACRARLVDPAD
ncbi:pilus assembly protein TadG-related protein [Amorphus sp. MBR-141]